MSRPKSYRLTRELLLNDLAIRCFRDIADQDYIAARLAYHHQLPEPSLWQSQQALEKYLKCVLLLNRIPAIDGGHSLTDALRKIEANQSLSLQLTPATRELIEHLDEFGTERYLTTSMLAFGANVVHLDRAVWELRRFCSTDERPRKLTLIHGKRPPRYSIGGWIESVLSEPRESERRRALVRENGFWGPKRNTIVRVLRWMTTSNAPLWMHPEILPLAARYIYLPKHVIAGYKSHVTPHLYVPEEGVEIDLAPTRDLLRARPAKRARRRKKAGEL